MQWFIGRDGKESGPVTFSDLSERARDGRLRRDDLVWCQGMQNREVAEQIPGLWASPEASETSGPDQSDPSQSQSQAVPSEPIATEPPQSDVSAAKADLRPMKKSNFIVRHWRGELPLPVSYWVLVVLLGLVVVYLCGVAADALAAVDIGPLAIGLYVVALMTLLSAITAWQLVGTWRSAGNYMKSSKTPFWGGLARFVVIIACIRAAVDFYTLAGPMLSAGVNLALRGDDTPAYQLHLLEGGKEVELSGGMPYGTADALKAILDAGPDINVVHLNSDGGWIVEGEKIARMIRSRKIDTFTSTECSSACTIAFLGGTSRYLSSKGRLGFHSASFGSIDAKDVPEFNDDFRRALRANGTPSWFINKAMRTSSTSMWYPTHKELKTAGIITRVANANQFGLSGIGGMADTAAVRDANDRAIADFTKAIKLNPNDATAYASRGLAYGMQGEVDRAIADFTKAIALNPNDALAYTNRGAAYGMQGEFDRAIADFDKTIALNPKFANAYTNRGAAYGGKGEFDRAIADFRKALEIDPSDQDAKEALKILGVTP